MENKDLREEIEKVISTLQVDGVPMYARHDVDDGDRQVYWGVVEELSNLLTQQRDEIKREAKIAERGWGGHFIASNRCRFRRNTLIEVGRKKVVVSTVGLLYLNRDDNIPDTLGINRYYETMAFQAKKEGAYWEADVTNQVNFESNWALDYYNDSSDNDANEMHDAVVKEITENLTQQTLDKGDKDERN